MVVPQLESVAGRPYNRGEGGGSDEVPRLVPVQRGMRRAARPDRRAVRVPALRRAPGGRAQRRGPEEPQPGRVDVPLRPALHDDRVPLRQRRLGKDGVDIPPYLEREHRLDVRRRHEPLPRRASRRNRRARRPLDQAERQQPLRLVQGPGHHRPRFRRQGDDEQGQGRRGSNLRVHGRHVRVGIRLLRGRRDPVRGVASQGQGVRRPAHPAVGKRRHHPCPRHRLRRVHGHREAAERGPQVLPGELGQSPAYRGTEDREHRDYPAGRLGGARLGDRARRQFGQHHGHRAGLPHDARPGPHPAAPAPRLRPVGLRQPPLPQLSHGVHRVRACRGFIDRRQRHTDRQPRQHRPRNPDTEGVRRHSGAGDRG